MTPKQIAGTLYFAARRKRFEKADTLAITAMGSRGDPKDLKKQHADWTKE